MSSELRQRDWPHAPIHRLNEAGTYIVTAGTHEKLHLFRDAERLTYLTNALLTLAQEYGWRLQVWAVFSNHYHFVAESAQPASLKRFVQYLHSISAKHVNRLDGTPGRTAWFQYWDTQLTFHRSFLARLNYVHTNAVKHRLARRPDEYPWCSAGWFARRAPRAFYATVMSFPVDKIAVPDDFAVLPPALRRICGVREPCSRFCSSNCATVAKAAAGLPHSKKNGAARGRPYLLSTPNCELLTSA